MSRLINANTTQNQCNSFLLVDDITLEQGATNCYASTSVSVLNENKNLVYTYDTTSNIFNINVTEINPYVRWNKINNNQYSSIININNYDVGVKNIDIRINERLTSQLTPSTVLNSYTLTAPYTQEQSGKTFTARFETGKSIVWLRFTSGIQNSWSNPSFNRFLTAVPGPPGQNA